MRWCFFIWFILGTISSTAQVVDADYLDLATRFPITKNMSQLRTLTPVSIDSIVKVAASFEAVQDKPVLIYNYDPYFYWFRFVIKSEKPQELLMLMAPVGLLDGRLYQKRSGVWQQVAQSGIRYRFEDRSYQFTHYTFPFAIDAHRLDTIYLSVDASNVYKSFGFALFNPKELMIFQNKIYLVFGIIEGLLILFFVFNVALFFVLKETLNLWYALYIALLFFIVMKNDQLDQEFLLLDSEWAFRMTPYMSIGALAIAVLMHVVQHFLKESLIQSRRLYHISTILKLTVMVSAFVHAIVFHFSASYMTESVAFLVAKHSTLLCIIMIIVDCIYCVRRKNKSALFLLAGTLVFMIGSVQRLFFPSTLSFLFPPTTFHIGIITEVFVISLGLLFRYRNERLAQQKRVEQERKRNALVKQEVAERTAHNLSVELHDTINPDLALVNLNIHSVDSMISQRPLPEDKIRKKLLESQHIVSDSINGLRDLSRTLKYVAPIGVSLTQEVQGISEKYSSAQLQVQFELMGNETSLENERRAMVIKIVREALQNVVKHAYARKVLIRLQYGLKSLNLIIMDDGVGFDSKVVNHSENGINNIKNHCKLANASCEIVSEKGAGTKIDITLPFDGVEK